MKWKKYRKSDRHSYTFGAFPTMELIDCHADWVLEILISEQFSEREPFVARLKRESIPYRIDDRDIRRLSPKGNVYVIGVFEKKAAPVRDKNHLVLDRVSDMGNLGSIVRTMLAMGIEDLVLLGTTCDLYDPRTVRASMGALFHIRHAQYETIDDYRAAFPFGRGVERQPYFFMLGKEKTVSLPELSVPQKWAVFFGNEGSGLPAEYEEYGTCVRIPQSEHVDSLNLTTAVAVGLYDFIHGKPKREAR